MALSEIDEGWMRVALGLARRGLGRVWPNPAVGCVLVAGGVVVGRGATQPGGRPHAEAVALAACICRCCGSVRALLANFCTSALKFGIAWDWEGGNLNHTSRRCVDVASVHPRVGFGRLVVARVASTSCWDSLDCCAHN